MPPLTEIDRPTASAILQIQLRDLALLEDRRKGKGRAGDASALSDSDLALALYKCELENVQQSLADGQLARSNFAAVVADRAALDAHAEEEDRAARDRAFARELDARDDEDGNGEGDGSRGNDHGKGTDEKQGWKRAGKNVERTDGGHGSSQGVRGPTYARHGPNNDVKKPKVEGNIAGQARGVQGSTGKQQQVDTRGLKRPTAELQDQTRDTKRFKGPKFVVNLPQRVRQPAETKQHVDNKNLMRPAAEVQGQTRSTTTFKDDNAVVVKLPKAVEGPVEAKRHTDSKDLKTPAGNASLQPRELKIMKNGSIAKLAQDTKHLAEKHRLKRSAEEAPEQSRDVKKLKQGSPQRHTQIQPEQPRGLKRPREEDTRTDELPAQLYSAYRDGFEPDSDADMDTDSDTVTGIKYLTNYPSPEIDHAGSSKRRKLTTSSSTTGQETQKTEPECSICLSEYPAFIMLSLPCRHFVCKECLQTLFQRASIDEEEFPPRCCQTIPLANARIFLSQPIVAAFEKAKTEYEAQNRIYCSRAQCSLFIPPANISVDYACCTKCGMITCTHCRAEYHDGECPKDDALQKLLQTASKQGWKRCYVCWRVVELHQGCFHMVCRCGAQFCYRCGKKWKTCRCPKWEEKRLLSSSR